MFPQVWAPLFRVADVTGFVYRGFEKQKIVVSIVRVVTVAARHVAQSQRVAAGLEGIGAAFRVALKTGLLLRERIENPVPGAVYLVAGRTGHIGRFVGAAKPAQPPMGFMAAQADLVLVRSGGFRVSPECVHRFLILASLLRIDMVCAGTVAGLALKLGKRGIRVGTRCMRGGKYCASGPG